MNLRALGKLRTAGFGVVVLTLIISFQNCGKKFNTDGGGVDNSFESLSSLSSSGSRVLGEDVQFAIPLYVDKPETSSEFLGDCTIENQSRGLSIYVRQRAAKTDCAQACSTNQSLFVGDRVSCRIPGYSNSVVSNDTARNRCLVRLGGQPKVDDYSLTYADCLAVCGIHANNSSQSSSELSCSWQASLLFLRKAGELTETPTGSCDVSALNDLAEVQFRIAYSDGVTEDHCNRIVEWAAKKVSPENALVPTTTFIAKQKIPLEQY